MSPVTQSDLEKYQNNDRVRYCIKKYISDEHRAGIASEKALQKA